MPGRIRPRGPGHSKGRRQAGLRGTQLSELSGPRIARVVRRHLETFAHSSATPPDPTAAIGAASRAGTGQVPAASAAAPRPYSAAAPVAGPGLVLSPLAAGRPCRQLGVIGETL